MITDPAKIPNEKHFAALVLKTNIDHEGDERSRTCPGHGYPAHTETVHSIDYIPFNSKKEMDEWVVKAETKTYEKPKYRLIEAQPLVAKITATVLYQ